MTTVAYRDGHLAADQCVTAGTRRTFVKKLHLQDLTKGVKIAVAMAGVVENQVHVRNHIYKVLKAQIKKYGVDDPDNWPGVIPLLPYPADLRDYADAKDLPHGLCMFGVPGEWTLAYELETASAYKIPRGQYFAVGKDAAVALGAMYAGATAFEAVKSACHHGTATGGDVNVVDWRFREA